MAHRLPTFTGQGFARRGVASMARRDRVARLLFTLGSVVKEVAPDVWQELAEPHRLLHLAVQAEREAGHMTALHLLYHRLEENRAAIEAAADGKALPAVRGRDVDNPLMVWGSATPSIAVDLLNALEPWFRHFRTAPEWFADSVLLSLEAAATFDEVRLRPSIWITHFPAGRVRETFEIEVEAWSGEEPIDAYIARELNRAKAQLTQDANARLVRLRRATRRGRREEISKARPRGVVGKQEHWAALYLLGDEFEDIAGAWDGEPNNVRRLVGEVLEWAAWPVPDADT